MRDHVVRDAVAVGLLLGALLVAVALASHSPMDPSPLHLSTERERPHNLAGWLGATVSAALLGLLGLPALLLPVLAAALGWRMLRDRPLVSPRQTMLGWLLVLLALPGFASLGQAVVAYRGGTVSVGGVVGMAEAQLLGAFAGPVGRVVILGFLLIIGLVLVSGVPAGAVLDRALGRVARMWHRRRERLTERRRQKQKESDRRRVLAGQLKKLEEEEGYRGTVSVKEVEGRGRFRIVRKSAEAASDEMAAAEEPGGGDDVSAPRRRRPRERVVQEEFEFVDDLESYDLPRTTFLERPQDTSVRDSNALIEISRLITEKCQEFKVSGEVVNIRTGPVITTYEFRLDSGVKISAVQNLAEDLALALKVESIRIERIPGRATVGIEVPNPEPETIRLRDLIESTEFQKAKSLLTLSLGVDIHGRPFFSDLARMPHLLIGGFTGAGKSVGINAMIMSILYKAHPDQVRFILVDPKMVELGVYADIPHLLTPIITNPKKAANALGWAVAEMDARYRRLAALGVRNLSQYNQLVGDPVQLRRVLQRRGDDEALSDAEPMPIIVVIIDELADLMLASSRAVEESITRLAQKARAVGIHLVCATQRPSVDILTGIIKANFPCRMAYKVRSKFDSRTILDAVGAEHLLGRGDMLYLPPGSSTLVRLHGPLVTEKEIGTVVRYVKRFGKPEYRREVLSHAPLGENGKGGRRGVGDDGGESLDDPMYDDAARLVVKTRKASASFIQRRLRLGYTRAARLVDMMEQEGLVGPLDGSKGREVLVPGDHFEEVDATKDPVDDD